MSIVFSGATVFGWIDQTTPQADVIFSYQLNFKAPWSITVFIPATVWKPELCRVDMQGVWKPGAALNLFWKNVNTQESGESVVSCSAASSHRGVADSAEWKESYQEADRERAIMANAGIQHAAMRLEIITASVEEIQKKKKKCKGSIKYLIL